MIYFSVLFIYIIQRCVSM